MRRHFPTDLSALPPGLRFMVERLNSALEKGRFELSHLMSQSVPGKELSLFFIALGGGPDDCTVGPLGIINGLLDLLSVGVPGEDALIAIDLHEDIRNAQRAYVTGPIEYVGKMTPIEESWAKMNLGAGS